MSQRGDYRQPPPDAVPVPRLLATFLILSHPKGISSYQMAKHLEITQKSAWHLGHRIRDVLAADGLGEFAGPVKVDETYIGGKARNMHAHKRRQRISGRGTVNKTPVIGAVDRATNRVTAKVIDRTDAATLCRITLRVNQHRLRTDPAADYQSGLSESRLCAQWGTSFPVSGCTSSWRKNSLANPASSLSSASADCNSSSFGGRPIATR